MLASNQNLHNRKQSHNKGKDFVGFDLDTKIRRIIIMNQSIVKKLKVQKEKEAKAQLQLTKAKSEAKKLHDEVMISLGEEVLKQLGTKDIESAFDEIGKQLHRVGSHD